MNAKSLAVLAMVAVLGGASAQAVHGHGFRHGRGDAAAWAIGGLLVGVAAGTVIASTPPPPAPAVVYVPAPAPTVVSAPVVVAPPPAPAVVVVPATPVVYAPAPVVYGCPPPVVYGPPVCRPRFVRPHFRVGFSVGW